MSKEVLDALHEPCLSGAGAAIQGIAMVSEEICGEADVRGYP